MTIMEQLDQHGNTIRRCDARCYTAKGTTCHCICGGTNHGKGLNHAINNAYQHHEQLTPPDEHTTIRLRQLQLTLFETQTKGG